MVEVDELLRDAKVIVLQPGDLIVIEAQWAPMADQLDAIGEWFAGHKVVVLAGASLGVIRSNSDGFPCGNCTHPRKAHLHGDGTCTFNDTGVVPPERCGCPCFFEESL